MERIFESAADRCHEMRATSNAQEATPKEISNVAAEPKTLALLDPADPHPVGSLANVALPPSSTSNSQILPSPKGSTTTSIKTSARVRAAKLVSDKITTCVAGHPWREKVKSELLPLLEKITLPSDEDYMVDVRPVTFEHQHPEDRASARDSPHSLGKNLQGINGNLSEEECLLSFFIAQRKTAATCCIPIKRQDLL